MTQVQTSPDVDSFISALPPLTQEIMAALRRLIFDAEPAFEEAIKWGVPVYSKNGIVCYISPMKKHVNLGFYKGTSLNDPEGLLEGTGKDLRHVKVRNLDSIREDAFQALVRDAVRVQEGKR